MQPPAMPPSGRAFAGAAAASFATGPTLVLLFGLFELVRYWPEFNGARLGGWLTIAAYSVFVALIGSIPAASLNAFVLGRFARRGADEAVVAAISGGTIGCLVAIILVALASGGGRLDGIFLLWFSATGTMMGLLHWVIAIRPQRRWRLSLLRDQEAIRAME
jgi:hypothetical protein